MGDLKIETSLSRSLVCCIYYLITKMATDKTKLNLRDKPSGSVKL